MWVISKVLHTVRFLFKNEFILQNAVTVHQCNLNCALSQRSNVWAGLLFLSGCLRCWCVWLLGHLIRHLLSASEVFPMECFLQFWEQVKVKGPVQACNGIALLLSIIQADVFVSSLWTQVASTLTWQAGQGTEHNAFEIYHQHVQKWLKAITSIIQTSVIPWPLLIYILWRKTWWWCIAAA
jgi:hypothetical protein